MGISGCLDLYCEQISPLKYFNVFLKMSEMYKSVKLIYTSHNLFFKTFSKEVNFNLCSSKKENNVKEVFKKTYLHEMKGSYKIKCLVHYLLYAMSGFC